MSGHKKWSEIKHKKDEVKTKLVCPGCGGENFVRIVGKRIAGNDIYCNDCRYIHIGTKRVKVEA